MPSLHTILGVLAVAAVAASTVLLITEPGEDTLPSLGFLFAVAAGHYLLIDRRMSRVERLTARTVRVERDVLAAVRDRDRARLN